MAKQRSRRRTAAMFEEYSSRKNVEAALNDYAHKEEQSKYQEVLAKLEADILARTVFVTNVLDLNQTQNLVKLKTFMEEKYGPVVKCERTSYGSRKKSSRPHYPPARVRFASERAAQRVFQGAPLSNAKPITVSCPEVGAKGILRIQPSNRYNGIADDELNGDVIQVDVTKLSLGHWCPRHLDTFIQYSPSHNHDHTNSQDTDEFLEELAIEPDYETRLCMSIDLKKRNVEIATIASEAGFLKSIVELALNPSDRPRLPISGNDLATQNQQINSFRFKELRGHMEVCSSGNFLVFSLKWPPKLYRTALDVYGYPCRNRDTKFLNAIGADFGRCLAFQVHLSQGEMDKLSVHDAVSKLCQFGVLAKDFEASGQSLVILHRTIADTTLKFQWRLEHQMDCVQSSCHPEIGFLLRALIDNSRCDWYHMLNDSVERTLSCGSKREVNLPQILQSECSTSQEKTFVSIRTLERMLGTQEGCTQYPCKLFCLLVDPGESLQDDESEWDERVENPIPEYCVRVPRVLLSPCQVRVIDVGTEMSNRAIRRFTKELHLGPCSFLRLQVGDETGKHLFGDLTPSICTHISTVVLNGFKVNGQMFKFLAYSSSQLKKCSLWMVSSMEPSYQLRSNLGDFACCGTVSKWAARLGQCLSTTVEYTITDRLMGKPAVVPDVISRLGMEHSDGTGIISRPLFERVCTRIPFALGPKDMSIMQIRFGGAKGTLSAWDVSESLLQKEVRNCKHDIILRESMTKFQSEYDRIEVCAVGTSVPYYLNRFVILLLEAHGVPLKTFLSMQNEMIDKLDKMIADRKTAIQMLPSLSGPDDGLVSCLQYMLNCGISPSTDPFLFSALHAMRQHHLFTLRKKARIFVEKGAVLMGGLDESGILQEGEVFVQFSKRDVSKPGKLIHEVVSGSVLVTKHPAMHMGDVRMLRAVQIPELRGHRNVILFSQHGDRPEADKMSGSDLDGDQFAVTWDDRLFLYNGNHDPLDFTPPPASTSTLMPSEICQHDDALIKHFVNHMVNDNLGRIAMLWLDYASRFMADCEKCVQLAKLHSIAVDFPKSGVPAVLPKDLMLPPDFKVGHWREVKKKDSVHCESIVGQLYDQVVGRNKDNELLSNHKAIAHRKVDSYGRVLSFFESRHGAKSALNMVIYRHLPFMLGLEGITTEERALIMEESHDMMIRYNEDIRTIMNKYQLHSEGELFTGCIRKYHKLYKTKQHSIAEEVRRSCRALRHDHRNSFFRVLFYFVGPPSPSIAADQKIVEEESQMEDSEEQMISRIQEVTTCRSPETIQGFSSWERAARKTAFLLAGANYVLAYWIDEEGGDRSSALFSFPWLVADVIYAGIDEAHHNDAISGN